MEKDLFEFTEELPAIVTYVLHKYSFSDESYETCEKLLAELEPLGYSFEYGLDAVPYNLHKIEVQTTL